ncbi:hypothetical protein [Sinomonas sp. G460-2]|uniref:hypothetical protein n=1 Tax=Sinomonas sp. G460-2 TaxID=3393464 RepID=UPI0039F0B51B
MSADSDARRIAEGPPPSELIGAPNGGEPEPAPPPDPPFDPLRLCIFATIALLGWLAGPLALVAFSTIGFIGYAKARRAGLTTSKCFLRDTRLVLLYLGALTLAGLWGTYALAARLAGY